MSVRESEDTIDNISVGEREDPSVQLSPGHRSTSKKDDLMITFLSDLRNDMQVTHKLLAQMLAQGNESTEASALKQIGRLAGNAQP